MLLIYPFIYKILKSYKQKGIIVLFSINIFWEVLKIAYGVPESCYRLLIFRYIFLIGFGSYCFLAKRRIDIVKCCILAIIGICFIIYTIYLGYDSYIFRMWTRTSVMAILYVLPLFCLAIKSGLLQSNYSVVKPILTLGRCSYYIFLVQMTYYNFAAGLVYKFMNNRCLALLFSILICVIAGYTFYRIIEPIRKKVLINVFG